MKTPIVSKEYRATKQALGAPSSLSLTPDIVGSSEQCVSALVAALADLATVAGLDDLEERPLTGFGVGAGADGVQPHHRRELTSYSQA